VVFGIYVITLWILKKKRKKLFLRFFFKIQKVATFLRFFAVFRTFSRTIVGL